MKSDILIRDLWLFNNFDREYFDFKIYVKIGG